AEGDGSVDTP
nr:RecName: Full=Mucorpepsin [Mucor thermohyalospora]